MCYIKFIVKKDKDGKGLQMIQMSPVPTEARVATINRIHDTSPSFLTMARLFEMIIFMLAEVVGLGLVADLKLTDTFDCV
jgi:hypothetical protein